MGRRGGALEEKFNASWKLDSDTGCWVWQRGTDGRGHPYIVNVRAQVIAARFSYATFVAPLPKAMDVRRTCGRVLCVNPKHLFAQPRKVSASERGGMRRSES